METLVERCAGLDVHKDSVTACVRVPDSHAGRHTETRRFTTTTAGLGLLAEWLASFGVTRVGMESTGCYWKPVWQLLEGQMECWLLNAAHLHNVPGRKTDVADAAWIAQLVEHGLVRPSFVPPRPIRELRELTRYRKTQIQERSREVQRLDKVLQDAGIKLSSVATDVIGVSGQIRTLSEILPSQAAPREPVELRGVNLFIDGESEANLRVRFGAHDTPANVQPDAGGTVITTTVPEDAPLGETDVSVVTASGATTNSRGFEVVAGGPQITAVEPDPIVLRPGATMIIDGKGFLAPGDEQAQTGQNQVALGGHPLQADPADWKSTQVRAQLPRTDADLGAAGWTAGTGQLVVRDSWGRPSAARSVKLATPSAQRTDGALSPAAAAAAAAAAPTVPYVVQPGEHLLMIAERLFTDNGVATPAPAEVSRLAAHIAELNAGQLSGPTLVKENHAIQVPAVIPTLNGAGQGHRT